MEAPLQVISKEIIKPSSQTPHHLRKLKLSYLDQLAPPVYVPLIFFYEADESRGLTTSNHLQLSQRLKQSLSNTLTSFYPLAGRIQDSSLIDCNDAGAEFIEARVQAQLKDALQEPIIQQLKYLPADATAGSLLGVALIVVKITFFDCGGIAVGVCVSHKLADCVSIMAFMNAWAASCRGEAEFSQLVSFDLVTYFPSRDFPGSDSNLPFPSSKENLVTKRFVFDKEKLAALKEAATSPSVKDPTRVEVVSAFIWKHFIDVAKFENPVGKRTFLASHPVNLRPRTSPHLHLENIFGNCIMPAMATSNLEDVEDFHELVSRLRSGFRRIDRDYIGEAQNGDSYLNDIMNLNCLLVEGGLEIYSCSSWCGFAVYEIDYGWGKPVSFCTSSLPLRNSSILVKSRSGDGVEAFVTLPEDNVEILESQIKLLNIKESGSYDRIWHDEI
ncbi:vinorine synthase-like [Sesamum indicum]|uniref:Vinorine synthase-like n=1 Tax=Sesamum indicum TaxID=4182 RepID=A0A6I9U301_SESIN|nr:vinorine synthase-like [Sesamum indicum]